MNIILVAIFLSVVLVVIWTIVVRKKAPDKEFDWLNTVVATFLSAFLAVMAGLWVYNLQVSDADQRQKENLTMLLQQEFSRVRQILSGEEMNISIGGTTTKAVITYIEPIGIEKAAQSGLFNPTETFHLLLIAQEIRVYDLDVQFLFEALNTEPASQASESRSTNMVQNVNSAHQSIIGNIEAEAKLLHIDFIEIK